MILLECPGLFRLRGIYDERLPGHHIHITNENVRFYVLRVD